MRLINLYPSFVGKGGEGVSDQDGNPIPRREGVGVEFDCPCGCQYRCYVPFENPLDGGPRCGPQGWQRTGTTFDTLTITPSILRGVPCVKRWHGFITSGEVST